MDWNLYNFGKKLKQKLNYINMRKTEQIWVIVMPQKRTQSNRDVILVNTFKYSKKDCINNFIGKRRFGWNYWHSVGYKCVKANLTIETIK